MRISEWLSRLSTWMVVVVVVTLFPTIGLIPAGTAHAVPYMDSCASVSTSVYVSVYEPLSGKTVCSQNGGIVLNPYPEFATKSFDMTVHVPSGVNYVTGYTQSSDDNNYIYTPATTTISGGQFTFSGLNQINGSNIYLEVQEADDVFSPVSNSFFIGNLNQNSGQYTEGKVKVQVIDSVPGHREGENIFLQSIAEVDPINHAYTSKDWWMQGNTAWISVQLPYSREITATFRTNHNSTPNNAAYYTIMRSVSMGSEAPIQEINVDISSTNTGSWVTTAFNLVNPALPAPQSPSYISAIAQLRSSGILRSLNFPIVVGDLGKRIEYNLNTDPVMNLDGSRLDTYFNLSTSPDSLGKPGVRIQHADLQVGTGSPTVQDISFANLVPVEMHNNLSSSSSFTVENGFLLVASSENNYSLGFSINESYNLYLPNMNSSLNLKLEYSVRQIKGTELIYNLKRDMSVPYQAAMTLTPTTLVVNYGSQPNHLEKIIQPSPSSGYFYSAQFANVDGDLLQSVIDPGNGTYVLSGTSFTFTHSTDSSKNKTVIGYPSYFYDSNLLNLNEYSVSASNIPTQATFLSYFSQDYRLRFEAVGAVGSLVGLQICASFAEDDGCDYSTIEETDSNGIAHFDLEYKDRRKFYLLYSEDQPMLIQASNPIVDSSGIADKKIKVVSLTGHGLTPPSDSEKVTLEDLVWFAQRIKSLELNLDLDSLDHYDLADLEVVLYFLVPYEMGV